MSKTKIFLIKAEKTFKNKFKWQTVSEKEKASILKNIKWNPDLFFKHNSKFIAIDANLSNTFPIRGTKEIIRAKKKENNLEFYFLIPQDYNYDQIFSECFNNGFGIFKLDATKLSLVLNPDAKKLYRGKYKKLKKKILPESGHIPQKLLKYINDLKKISYSKILKDFASKYTNLRKGKNISSEEYLLVDKTIKRIFDNKTFHYSYEPYLKLKYYEPLLSGTREHYLHSFQIMLMGCVIIDKFYGEFVKYYKNVFPDGRDFSIEYIWLITSIFHDIGYPSQKASNLIGEPYGYSEDIGISGLEKIADKDDYKQAAIQLQSFIRHCCSKKRISSNWSPEISEDVDSTIKDILRELLLKKSHGVTSCFQFLTLILRESRAVSERAHRSLITTHVIPAVTAIALHDNKIWRKFTEQKIFPINITRFPFAALLMFLDALHDWKRSSSSEEIPEFATFEGFIFKNNCVEVEVYWSDPEKLARKIPEYTTVKEILKFNGLKLKLSDNLLDQNG